jgi:hypothetical protein
MKYPELKPCPNPVCESEEVQDCSVFVLCPACGMRGPHTNKGRNDAHADWTDRVRAIELWNALPRLTGYTDKLITPETSDDDKLWNTFSVAIAEMTLLKEVSIFGRKFNKTIAKFRTLGYEDVSRRLEKAAKVEFHA